MKEINEKDLEKTAGGVGEREAAVGKGEAPAAKAGEDITGNKCGKYEPNSESLRYLPPVLLKCSNCAHYRKTGEEAGYCELGETV